MYNYFKSLSDSEQINYVYNIFKGRFTKIAINDTGIDWFCFIVVGVSNSITFDR